MPPKSDRAGGYVVDWRTDFGRAIRKRAESVGFGALKRSTKIDTGAGVCRYLRAKRDQNVQRNISLSRTLLTVSC